MMNPEHEPVSVIASYNATTGLVTRHRLRWRHTNYTITGVHARYAVRRGRRLYHYFAIKAEGQAVTLIHDAEDLRWTIEAMTDRRAEAPPAAADTGEGGSYYC